MSRLLWIPLAALALALAGCGGGGSPLGAPHGTPGTTAPETPTIGNHGEIAASSYVIEAAPNGAPRFSVRLLRVPAGVVQLVLSNPSSKPHDIVVSGHGVHARGPVVTHAAGPAQRSRVTVELKPGRYAFYSDVGSDRARGMRGVLLVGALK